MKTKLGFSSGSAMRCCSPGRIVLVAALCTGMFAAQNGAAKEAHESPAPAKGAMKASLPVGRRATPMMISMAPMPAGTAAVAAPLRGPDCVGEVDAETSVIVPIGKSTLVPLAEPARNRTLGNPSIVQATLVSPRTLYLVGMAVGTTNMIVQGRSGSCQIIDVIVNIDPNGLQQSLRQLLPEERGIRVSTAAGNLVLGGHASSSPAAQQAMQIAQAFAGAQPTEQSQAASGSVGNGSTSVTQQSASTSKPAEVINMMTVDAPQQVMLEVKVAEVSKTLINQLGSALNIQGGFGSWSGALASNLLAGVTSLVTGSKANNRPLSFAIDAQKTDDLVKILAEPNLVAISGQEATFLAGGKIFIPVPQSSGTGVTSITLQEEEFGIGLKFTPTVLSNGRISLKVAPEVSELSPTGITLSATNVSGVSILPLITTRRASTVVQMSDGESFAIGGLMKSNVTGALKAIPGIGEVPVLGALARSTSFQQDLTELVFIVTPHLVKPLQTADLPLPTDSFSQPNEADVYATGNMEGRHPKANAAPAGAAPAASPMLAPASVSPPAPLPSPAPAQQTPAAPLATALPPAEPQAATPGPTSTAAPSTAAISATSPATTAAAQPTGDQEAERSARIESAAARIPAASAQGRRPQQVAKATEPSQAAEH